MHVIVGRNRLTTFTHSKTTGKEWEPTLHIDVYLCKPGGTTNGQAVFLEKVPLPPEANFFPVLRPLERLNDGAL